MKIEYALDKFSDSLVTCRNELENTIKQFETAKVEVERPFSKEEELKQMTARLDELIILLNLDKHENELADDEPDEGEAEPTRKEREHER